MYDPLCFNCGHEFRMHTNGQGGTHCTMNAPLAGTNIGCPCEAPISQEDDQC